MAHSTFLTFSDIICGDVLCTGTGGSFCKPLFKGNPKRYPGKPPEWGPGSFFCRMLPWELLKKGVFRVPQTPPFSQKSTGIAELGGQKAPREKRWDCRTERVGFQISGPFSCYSETGRIRFRRVRFQTPNSVSFSGLTEFRGASSVSSSQPIICVPKRTHRVFSENSPSLPQKSVSSLPRNSTLETVFRPFPSYLFRRSLPEQEDNNKKN